MVEADYRMKLIGIGIEPPPVKMATYVDQGRRGERNAAAVVFHAELRLRSRGRRRAGDGAGRPRRQADRRQRAGRRDRPAGRRRRHKARPARCSARRSRSTIRRSPPRSPVYGQLKNLIDLAVAAAFIQKQDYYAQSGWKMETLGDEKQYPIETFEAPKPSNPPARRSGRATA